MDRDKTPPDPFKNNQDWLLCGCLVTLFLTRVAAVTRLERLQQKVAVERQALLDKRQFRARLLEHKRKE